MLYRLIRHPVSLELVFREYEVVNDTPHYFDIQSRNIPNKAREKITTRIRKADVTDGTSKAEYYHSKEEALRIELGDRRWQKAQCYAKCAMLDDEIAELERFGSHTL